MVGIFLLSVKPKRIEMNAILNTNRTSMPGELVSHAIKNYHQEDSSDKAIISALKEINATI